MTDDGKHDAFLLLFCSLRRTLLSSFWTFSIWSSTRSFFISTFYKLIFDYINMGFKFFWRVVLGHKLYFLLIISGIPSSRVNSLAIGWFFMQCCMYLLLMHSMQWVLPPLKTPPSPHFCQVFPFKICKLSKPPFLSNSPSILVFRDPPPKSWILITIFHP